MSRDGQPLPPDLAAVRHARGRPRRAWLPVSAALLACFCLGATLMAGRAAAGAAPASADRDRDRVADDLEGRMERMGRRDRVGVIVALTRDASRESVERMSEEEGGFEVGGTYEAVDGFSARVTRGQVRSLARRSEVGRVELDAPVFATNDGARASFGVAEAQSQLPGLDGDSDGAPGSYSTDDLVAAVIDTGIDPNHLDLDGGKVIAFRDEVAGQANAYDDNGHGTHVAGTIAGDGDGQADRLYRGVAPGAALVGVKVLNSQGSGSTSDVIDGIDWVVANRDTYGIEAINLSLGASGCSDGQDLISAAVDAAVDAGIVVAAAAGNEGPGACTIGSPAAAAKAITVGAMADTDEGGFYQAYFSSRGRTADGRIKPDVSAPGVRIRSAASGTTSGYSTKSGTSMATPFVAGLALLMREATPGLTPQQVKDAITSTARDWARGDDNQSSGTTGADIDYGYGRLDGFAALTAAGAALGAAPAAPEHRLLSGTLAGDDDSREFQVEVESTAFPVAATLLIVGLETATSSTTDFDLYLLDPSGQQADSSSFDTRQEEVSFVPAATGTYTLRVRSRRGSGDFVLDASGGFGADVTPPDTTIDSGPSGEVQSSSASFGFSSDDADASFQCSLDSAAWEGCTSPRSYAGLAEGEHSFRVRATDAAGNTDPAPASRSWKVGSPTDQSGDDRDGGAGSEPAQPAGSTPDTRPEPESSKSPPSPPRKPSAGVSTVLAPERIDIAQASSPRGLPVPFSCGRACRVETRAYLGRGTAKRIGLATATASRYVQVGRGSARLVRAGDGRVAVRLSAPVRRRLHRASGAKLLLRTTVAEQGSEPRTVRQRVRLATKVRLATTLARGLTVAVRCSARCWVRGKALLGRRTAAQYRIRTKRRRISVARGSTRLGRAGSRRVTLRFSRALRARLGRARRLTLTVETRIVGEDGRARTLGSRVQLRR